MSWAIINLMLDMLRKQRNVSYLFLHQHNKNKMQLHSFPLLRWKDFATVVERKATDHCNCRHKNNQTINGPSINPKLIQVQHVMSEQVQTPNNQAGESSTTTPFTWAGMASQQHRQALRWGIRFCLTVNDLLTYSATQHWWLTLPRLILAKNAQEVSRNTKTVVTGCGPVWFDEQAMTNVFSLTAMEEMLWVTYKSRKENAFIVHTTKGPIWFIKSPVNLHYYKAK